MSVIRRLLGRLRRRPPTAPRPPEPPRAPGEDRRAGLRPQPEDDASIYPLF
ncbi:hypothetical protein GCM10009730_04140 [Streptomyces albidochromogenes]|uniref:hypothetical protein n=1 Tax=Streptomyces albidochromogenes TaxID=329524 RepID=UPI002FE8E874